MKFKTIIIILSLFISVDLFAQGFVNQFDTEMLKGGAKSVVLKPKGGHGKHLDWKVYQQIDTNGRIIQQDSYYKGKLRSIYKYFYDTNGYDSMFIVDYDFNTPTKKSKTNVSIKLNDNNQLIEYVSQPEKESYKVIINDFEYDSLNRIKSYTYIFDDTTHIVSYRNRLIYNKKNQISKIYVINSDNIIDKIITYEYDRKGNIRYTNASSYRIFKRYQYEDETFDEYLNIEPDSLEQIYDIYTYESKNKYLYDRKGNWIRKYKKHNFFYRLDEKRRIKY